MLTLCIGEVGRPRSTAPEGLISPRSLTPVVSILLDCSHFNICCDADEPDPTLDPEGLLLPRDIKYQATHKFRGFEPSLSVCLSFLSLLQSSVDSYRRQHLCSPISAVDAPPQPYSRLLSSHLFRVLARTSIVGEGLFISLC